MKKQVRLGLFLLGFLFFQHGLAWGQQQLRFSAGLLLGVNASQVQGDDDAGFNKLGLRGGVRGIARLTDRAELSMDILYSQRGSTNELTSNNNSGLRFVIGTNYIEVPVLFTFKDWLDEEDYYKVHFQGGLSYSRLFQSKVVDHPVLNVQENFNEDDFGFALGAGFFPNKHLGIFVRYNRSLVPLFNNRKFPQYKYSLFGYHLSFELAYIFN